MNNLKTSNQLLLIMSVRWLIHMKDGKTLTDQDCFPHELNIMEKRGYSPEDITSVERLINGRHLTIKKSEWIDTFFVATEEGIDVKMGGPHQAPPIITKRMIGCYIKETDPPLQVRLTMDPRNFNTKLEFIRVKKITLKGINARAVNPKKKGELDVVYSKEIIENYYSIVKSDDIEKFTPTANGLSCFLKTPPIRVELIIKNQNVLLGFTNKGEKLQIQ